MTDIKRKKGESFDAFMRRVKRRWQQSGRILQAKKEQYFTRKKSKNVARMQAVEYAKKNTRIAYLRKIGKLPPEEETKSFGHR